LGDGSNLFGGGGGKEKEKTVSEARAPFIRVADVFPFGLYLSFLLPAPFLPPLSPFLAIHLANPFFATSSNQASQAGSQAGNQPG
jgi:hypothetical protein